jgi:hypothetical protein
MALSQISIPADPSRDGRARALVPYVASWPKHTLKVAWGSFEAGTIFRRAPGSHGERYLVNSVACECPDYQQNQNICKHVRAIVLWEAGLFSTAKYLKKYEDLVPAECDVRSCTDDAQPREPGDEGRYCKRHRLGAF